MRFQTHEHRPHARAAASWDIVDTEQPSGKQHVGQMFDEIDAAALVATLNKHAADYFDARRRIGSGEPF